MNKKNNMKKESTKLTNKEQSPAGEKAHQYAGCKVQAIANQNMPGRKKKR